MRVWEREISKKNAVPGILYKENTTRVYVLFFIIPYVCAVDWWWW